MTPDMIEVQSISVPWSPGPLPSLRPQAPRPERTIPAAEAPGAVHAARRQPQRFVARPPGVREAPRTCAAACRVRRIYLKFYKKWCEIGVNKRSNRIWIS